MTSCDHLADWKVCKLPRCCFLVSAKRHVQELSEQLDVARKQLAARLVQADGLMPFVLSRACECDGCTLCKSKAAAAQRRFSGDHMPFGWRAVSGGQKQSHWKARSSTVALLDRIFQRQRRRRKSHQAAFMWSMARELTSSSALSVPRSDIHRPSIAKLSLPERMTPPHPGRQHQLSHREAHRSQYTFQNSARCQVLIPRTQPRIV